jgi:hypothetical protein
MTFERDVEMNPARAGTCERQRTCTAGTNLHHARRKDWAVMAKYGRALGLLLFITLVPQGLLCSQDKSSPKSKIEVDGRTLQLNIIGEEKVWNGRRGTVWIYKTPEGGQVAITSAQFDSEPDARRQTKEWLKIARRIATSEHHKDDKGHVVGERIVAIRQEGAGPEEFWIIHRSGTYCYLSQSLSLPLAIYAEQSIERERHEEQH